MARSSTPLAPRISAPDLPATLDPATLRPRIEVIAALVEGLSGEVDASNAHLSESVLRDVDVARLDLSRSRLVDVDIQELRGVEINGRETRWQTVRVTGGRVATLDLSRSSLSGVEFRGLRVDYLTLAGCDAFDVLFVDCIIGSLDAPQAKLGRVAFEGCRVDDVDNRGWKIEHVDLRGLDAVRYLDMAGLRGATMGDQQVTALGRHFAAAVGVDVRD
ncbi:hypothetical protein ASD65_01745 [Microbacterium sp. Root61]|uniref:pentapeptide repeat-containing protein n=1 Tax=Microbacterium sp. Root61 TaxID=1736570 RepID=UPI0007019B23|nr:pentapeptide repeat-containing protein [Microbacterium sp. Root61]KRA23280.1 hypothetical protein ASD65_01745 [Microbacterium sp. Root61]